MKNRIPWQLKWVGYMTLTCIGLMILFNYLARVNPGSAGEYKSYAGYAFDMVKVLVGMVIGHLGAGLTKLEELPPRVVELETDDSEALGTGDGRDTGESPE
jgi:hypothetical protein